MGGGGCCGCNPPPLTGPVKIVPVKKDHACEHLQIHFLGGGADPSNPPSLKPGFWPAI